MPAKTQKKFSGIFGTFYALLARRNFLSSIGIRHFSSVRLSNFMQKIIKKDDSILSSCVANGDRNGQTDEQSQIYSTVPLVRLFKNPTRFH